jgi:hypothetical protein
MSQPSLIKPNVQVDEQRQKRQEEGEDQLAMLQSRQEGQKLLVLEHTL